MIKIKWPGKYFTFRRTVRSYADKILTGSLLAIDPASGSSSMPGYALYEAGQLKERGVIDIARGKSAQVRLSELFECMREDFPKVDVLAVEMLRGRMVSPTLHWATGVIVAATDASVVVEVPIPFWKAIAKVTSDYIKSDDMDAALIGEVLIRLANEEED